MKRSTLIALAGVILVESILVSLIFLDAPHTGGDNAAYVSLGTALASGQGYVELWDPAQAAHTKYPPVFPALLALLISLGVTTWTGLKIVPAVSAVVAVAASFLWAERRAGLRIGLAVALVTGLSSTLLHHSRFLLSDVPFLAFTMLTLWLLDRGWETTGSEAGRGRIGDPADRARPGGGGGGGRDGGGGRGDGGGGDAEVGAVGAAADAGSRSSTVVLALGILCCLLAYFTRSAGLPLVVAVLGSFLLARRWRAGAAIGAVIGLPALVWLIRGVWAGSDEGRYASELFLIDPLDPGRGTIGVAGMIDRVVENATGYLNDWFPRAVVDLDLPGVSGLLVLVILLGAVGWGRALLARRGVAELFLPLYAGVILVWPPIWSGDRFALPLVPLLVFYALGVVRWLGNRVGPAVGRWAPLGLALMIAVPALERWNRERAQAELCREAVEAAGPWGCAGQAMLTFMLTAEWAGENLPDGAAVLSRKPRLFYVASGIPSRTYPFDDDPEALFREAEATRSRWVVLDAMSAQGPRFVGGTVLARPQRFCRTAGFGQPGTPASATVLGILPAGAPSGVEGATEEGRVTIAECTGDLAGRGVEFSPSRSLEIPILTGR